LACGREKQFLEELIMTVLRSKILLVCALVFVMCNAPLAVGDWNPGNDFKMHFPQLPNSTGWDVSPGTEIADDWSLRTMREKLVKIGAKVVSHARYVTFQMAEVLVSRSLFHAILERIHRLKPVPIGYD
jgi:hypothetical protein